MIDYLQIINRQTEAQPGVFTAMVRGEKLEERATVYFHFVYQLHIFPVFPVRYIINAASHNTAHQSAAGRAKLQSFKYKETSVYRARKI